MRMRILDLKDIQGSMYKAGVYPQLVHILN